MHALVTVSSLASIHHLQIKSKRELGRTQAITLGSTNPSKHHQAWTTSLPNHLLFLIGEFLAPSSTLLCSNRGQAQASACTAGSLARHPATSLAHQSSRRLRRPGRWPHALSEPLMMLRRGRVRGALPAPRQWNSPNGRSLTIDGYGHRRRTGRTILMIH